MNMDNIAKTGLAACAAAAMVAGCASLQAGKSQARATEPAGEFHTWAPTPPMGWNSWDCYGSLVDEEIFKKNADWQAEKLLDFGYEYCVVDIRWYVQNNVCGRYNEEDPVFTLDEWGRYLPDPKRFPSSAGGAGFKPLADYAHERGLKFGIHIMRGVPKMASDKKLPVKGAAGVTCDMIHSGELECPWLRDNFTAVSSKAGAQEYYDSIIELYASWGVDFIKCDDLSCPYHADEIEMIRKAIDKCGRRIVLSMSPGETPLDQAEHAAANANMWRIVGDLWDVWSEVEHLTDVTVAWLATAHRAGSWPDCDMLPLGRLSVSGFGERGDERNANFTREEARYLFTLMAIAKSPLMLGSDLPSLGNEDLKWTYDLITDPLLLSAHKNGKWPRALRHSAEETVIISDNEEEGTVYLALFNRTADWRRVEALGISANLAPHEAIMIEIPASYDEQVR
ncbi:MAG: glycoside hydrolase family 27 protein [Kiritimatiellae bacterium]|nr:glycoside hydrolase family 27 protein [Kiritimatiellia bacterium]